MTQEALPNLWRIRTQFVLPRMLVTSDRIITIRELARFWDDGTEPWYHFTEPQLSMYWISSGYGFDGKNGHKPELTRWGLALPPLTAISNVMPGWFGVTLLDFDSPVCRHCFVDQDDVRNAVSDKP